MNEASTIEFTLRPPGHGPVSIRLRRYLDRWVAEQVGVGRPLAIGLTAREALTAALSPLGESQVRMLLADLGLLEPSVNVIRLEMVGRGGAA